MPVLDSREVYYLFDQGQQTGPFTHSQLQTMQSQGSISRDAHVLVGNQWYPVSECQIGQRIPIHEPPGAPSGEELIELEVVNPTPPESMRVPTAESPFLLEEIASQFQTMSDAMPGHDIAELNAPPPLRDRIVVLGRRAAGKTVYLAKLYEKLWRTPGKLSMKALSGPIHESMIQVADLLNHGKWPPATISSMHIELEVGYGNKHQTMVGLDYAGELFRKAFVEEDTSTQEVKELLNHIDRAAAVILLIDPAIAISGNVNETVDDDFGMVKAVERLRQWPGGEDIPVVLVFTKFDQNKKLLQHHGDLQEIVLKYFPILHRTIKTFHIFSVSAVQVDSDGNGGWIPKPDSVPVRVTEPLRFCMEKIIQAEQKEEAELQRQREQQRIAAIAQAEEVADRRRQITFAVFIGGMVLIGVCLIVLIFILKS